MQTNVLIRLSIICWSHTLKDQSFFDSRIPWSHPHQKCILWKKPHWFQLLPPLSSTSVVDVLGMQPSERTHQGISWLDLDSMSHIGLLASLTPALFCTLLVDIGYDWLLISILNFLLLLEIVCPWLDPWKLVKLFFMVADVWGHSWLFKGC